MTVCESNTFFKRQNPSRFNWLLNITPSPDGNSKANATRQVHSFYFGESKLSQLTIVANIKSHPDKIDFVNSELEKLVPLTRAENGCVCYDLHRDNENPAHFMFYETWESHERWQDHFNSSHIQDYRAVTEGMIADFTLNEMTKIA